MGSKDDTGLPVVVVLAGEGLAKVALRRLVSSVLMRRRQAVHTRRGWGRLVR
jgi:hypothetical protein